MSQDMPNEGGFAPIEMPARCGNCRQSIEVEQGDYDEYYEIEVSEFLCAHCLTELAKGIEDQATAYAEGSCKITATTNRLRSAFKNARKIDLRHPQGKKRLAEFLLDFLSSCTNYEELVRRFAPNSKSLEARIFRSAIQERFDALIAEQALRHDFSVPAH